MITAACDRGDAEAFLAYFQRAQETKQTDLALLQTKNKNLELKEKGLKAAAQKTTAEGNKLGQSRRSDAAEAKARHLEKAAAAAEAKAQSDKAAAEETTRQLEAQQKEEKDKAEKAEKRRNSKPEGKEGAKQT